MGVDRASGIGSASKVLRGAVVAEIDFQPKMRAEHVAHSCKETQGWIRRLIHAGINHDSAGQTRRLAGRGWERLVHVNVDIGLGLGGGNSKQYAGEHKNAAKTA